MGRAGRGGCPQPPRRRSIAARTRLKHTTSAQQGDCVSTQVGTHQMIYWHRDLPPLDAEICGEGMLEATSSRVKGTLAGRDHLWDQCVAELMAQARVRLQQEVGRAHARYAHVLSESIDTRRNDATGEAWLHGTFAYVLLGACAGREQATLPTGPS